MAENNGNTPAANRWVLTRVVPGIFLIPAAMALLLIYFRHDVFGSFVALLAVVMVFGAEHLIVHTTPTDYSKEDEVEALEGDSGVRFPGLRE
jgi:hypothetical protein